jgi:DNA polymerase-4/protein ImuB
MPLNEALSRQSGVALMEPDMPHYRLAFGRILKALEERCPDVEDDGLGRAYIGIWGLEKLYGDDAHVVRVLANAVRGFDLRIGIGENKWLSYVAAAGSEHGRGRKVTGEPGRFMSRFPVDILPVPYESVQRMHSFGLHRMGDVAALPKSALQAQFGPEGTRIWELSNGMDGRPLVSRQPVEVVSEYLTFPDATANLSAILPAIESLLARAYTRPEMSRRFAREAALEAQVFRRSPWVLRVAFKEPAGSKNHALFAIKVKLDGVALPGPLEDLRLTLSGLTGEAGRQESMWSEVRRSEQLKVAVRQLHARLGESPPIYQVREMEPWSRIPERRHALVQLSP